MFLNELLMCHLNLKHPFGVLALHVKDYGDKKAA
jgi:hypothetical protein